jgi:hypothetical protein
MRATPSATVRDISTAAAVAAGPLAALAVSVHLSNLAPHVLGVAVIVSSFLQWRKRATHYDMVTRLFFFCFTFMLGVTVVYPWAVARLGMA